jgi:bifunctional N-acetylglucosamine-1-phosphate-uridyltransferase/glucosamine-1-phosphate-acetyltransferase GlmU-like protein
MLISVVPAAGLGTRLGAKVPKLFVELAPNLRVIDLLESTIGDLVDECCFVIRPDMVDSFKEYSTNLKSTFVIQEEPRGMGDAIFQASKKLLHFKTLLVVWGDQISLSKETLIRVIRKHNENDVDCTIPLVKVQNPYVHYEINQFNKLENLFQSREGDSLPTVGFSDIGVFLLKTNNILAEWESYLKQLPSLSKATHELNFLPFLVFLSKNGKRQDFPIIQDAFQATGMNTNVELENFKVAFKERGKQR